MRNQVPVDTPLRKAKAMIIPERLEIPQIPESLLRLHALFDGWGLDGEEPVMTGAVPTSPTVGQVPPLASPETAIPVMIVLKRQAPDLKASTSCRAASNISMERWTAPRPWSLRAFYHGAIHCDGASKPVAAQWPTLMESAITS
ncbi:hypothetical protein NUW58_g7583 [Xylaria curta]|uniref:Uncharacterized protein n=1 Tax=Xylaria curta TaxID=42375 RepID=A0ACC1NII0_9PEZI|nr:hypothetical protein NUW58_g7583 [Xylaria curta]